MIPPRLDAAYKLRDGRIISTGAIHEIPDGIEYEDIAEVGHSDNQGNFYTRAQAKALRNPPRAIDAPSPDNYDVSGPDTTNDGLMFKAVHRPSGQSVGYMTVPAKPDKGGMHSIVDSYLDSEHNHDFIKTKLLNHANDYLKNSGHKGLLIAEDIKKSILDPSAGYKITHEHHPDINMTTVRAHAPNGQVVGEAGFTHLPSGHLERETVKVHPDHQRKGIATALYNHAKEVTGKQIIPSSDQTSAGKLFSQSMIAKSEEIPDYVTNSVEMMMGEHYLSSPEFKAAKFMAGNVEVEDSELDQAKMDWEGNVLNMALAAYGLEINDKNKKILFDIVKISDLEKHFESAAIPRIVKPYSLTDTKISDIVQEAFSQNDVHAIKLNGKHSKGTAILEGEGKYWLIKPGSGKLSSARGLNEEQASQSRREVAFNKVAELLDLGQFFPEAGLITLDGTEVAVLEFFTGLTPFEKVKNDFAVVNMLHKYAQSGLLFKWAIVDYILGQTDRHSGNILIDEDHNIKFIDAGSSFSGPSFNPASDVKSWVPIYLRVYGPYKFNQLSPKQKFDSIPAASREGDLDLARWVSSISEREITEILNNYEINPQPVLNRLKMLKDYNGPKSEFLRKFYSNLIPAGVLND